MGAQLVGSDAVARDGERVGRAPQRDEQRAERDGHGGRGQRDASAAHRTLLSENRTPQRPYDSAPAWSRRDVCARRRATRRAARVVPPQITRLRADLDPGPCCPDQRPASGDKRVHRA